MTGIASVVSLASGIGIDGAASVTTGAINFSVIAARVG